METAKPETLPEVLARIGLQCEAVETDARPPDTFNGKPEPGRPAYKWNGQGWRVTLKLEGRTMALDFFTGRKPRLSDDELRRKGADDWNYFRAAKLNRERRAEILATMPASVVSCLVLDSCACDESFADWCGNFGYDTDSRSALESYLKCQDYGKELRALLRGHWSAVIEAAQDY